jgi:hypothetical protein
MFIDSCNGCREVDKVVHLLVKCEEGAFRPKFLTNLPLSPVPFIADA